METYTEKLLNVTRPHLNETCLDADVYRNEITTSMATMGLFAREQSLVKAWVEPDQSFFDEERTRDQLN